MTRITEKIAEFSQNLITAAADLVLFKIYLGADWKLVGESSEGGTEGEWEGLEEAFPELPELTAAKILRALRFLLKQGYIGIIPHEDHLVPQITEEGGKRLDSIFPVYQKERPWDQKFYLVNYDVPVGKNSKRDALRSFLKDELGCVMLQSSVWLTPYNPVKSLSKFVEKGDLSERVVVSVLLEDWALPAVGKIYGLEDVNRRYREFVGRAEGVKGEKGLKEDERMVTAFEYFSILRDDPQLPFELLPKDWAGEQAQEVFEKLFFGK
jgi:DNA-binding transcriptional regulator PaaX